MELKSKVDRRELKYIQLPSEESKFAANRMPKTVLLGFSSKDGNRVDLSLNVSGKSPDLKFNFKKLAPARMVALLKSLGDGLPEVELVTSLNTVVKNISWGEARILDETSRTFLRNVSPLQQVFSQASRYENRVGDYLEQAAQIHFRDPDLAGGRSFHLVVTCGYGKER